MSFLSHLTLRKGDRSDLGLLKKHPNGGEECCSSAPHPVVAHNESEITFIIEDGGWNGSKDVSYSH